MRNLNLLLGCLAIGILIAPFGIYLFQFHGSLSTDPNYWGQFGSYFSGIYGPMAFVVLAYTTNITRKQFKIQNEDNVFFKLFDSLQGRIVNSSAMVGDTKHSAHQTLKLVVTKFHEELSALTIELARHLLCESPEDIADVHYMKIFQVINGMNFLDTFTEDKRHFIADISGQKDFNGRWEKLKYYIGSRGEESATLREALRATGSVNFYKIPFSKRRQYYIRAVQSISNDYGELLDGYQKNICFLLEFSATAINREVYVAFLKAQLTKYELIILFYLVAGRNDRLDNMEKLRGLGIMDGLITMNCQSLMIDLPSIDELSLEVENVFGDFG